MWPHGALHVCRWTTSGLEAQMRAKKRVFWEDRDAAACEATLRNYRAHLAESEVAGALLMCVVGAKLSEGINFGDRLGRCVVNFGLPYPDLRGLELRERLAHIERMHAATGRRAEGSGGSARESGPLVRNETSAELGAVGREMYSNMCMQAVNQCVGRAIRHVKDYAAVVLVDTRFTSAERGSTSIVGKLPSWLTMRWHDCPTSIGPALASLSSFFQSMSPGRCATEVAVLPVPPACAGPSEQE
jgi:chromosome transmission fidelity protein 1